MVGYDELLKTISHVECLRGAIKKEKSKMKKLIMAVAIVAITAAAHASTFSWGLGSGSFDATKFASGTAYIFYGSNGAALSLPDTTTWAAKTIFAAADLQSSGASLLQTATIKNGLFVHSDESLANATEATEVKVADVGGSTATKQTNFYMAIISDDGLNVALSTVSKKMIANATTAMPVTWATSDITVYTASAVPEPTSGLLLLLGVAGLALRRKQK